MLITPLNDFSQVQKITFASTFSYFFILLPRSCTATNKYCHCMVNTRAAMHTLYQMVSYSVVLLPVIDLPLLFNSFIKTCSIPRSDQGSDQYHLVLLTTWSPSYHIMPSANSHRAKNVYQEETCRYSHALLA